MASKPVGWRDERPEHAEAARGRSVRRKKSSMKFRGTEAIQVGDALLVQSRFGIGVEPAKVEMVLDPDDTPERLRKAGFTQFAIVKVLNPSGVLENSVAAKKGDTWFLLKLTKKERADVKDDLEDVEKGVGIATSVYNLIKPTEVSAQMKAATLLAESLQKLKLKPAQQKAVVQAATPVHTAVKKVRPRILRVKDIEHPTEKELEQEFRPVRRKTIMELSK